MKTINPQDQKINKSKTGYIRRKPVSGTCPEGWYKLLVVLENKWVRGEFWERVSENICQRSLLEYRLPKVVRLSHEDGAWRKEDINGEAVWESIWSRGMQVVLCEQWVTQPDGKIGHVWWSGRKSENQNEAENRLVPDCGETVVMARHWVLLNVHQKSTEGLNLMLLLLLACVSF